jgi:acetolactate synthase I/II/III large subunit
MMQEKFSHSFGTDFDNPDFVQLAESFGINGVRPNSLSEFELVLKNTLNPTREITLIDIVHK